MARHCRLDLGLFPIHDFVRLWHIIVYLGGALKKNPMGIGFFIHDFIQNHVFSVIVGSILVFQFAAIRYFCVDFMYSILVSTLQE